MCLTDPPSYDRLFLGVYDVSFYGRDEVSGGASLQGVCVGAATSPSHLCGILTIFKWDSAAFQNDNHKPVSRRGGSSQVGTVALPAGSRRLASSGPLVLPPPRSLAGCEGSRQCREKPAAALAQRKPALGPGCCQAGASLQSRLLIPGLRVITTLAL